ncbi:hypothetical protein FVEN_g5555 [Fusarium venenatum]|nr:hypothetical protein FVEN_g5555 [Fusarium venenatum]
MIPYLPDEILSAIFSHLLTPSQRHHCRDDWHHDSTQVRLVCHRWNAIATKCLLGTLVLRHSGITMNDKFRAWHKLVDSDRLRPDREGRWPEFESAINRIRHLPKLDAIEVRFTAACIGPEGEIERNHQMNLMDVSLDITPVEEPTNTRLHSLKALARAIQERNKRPNLSTVRELVLENLQNVPILDSVATDPLRDIERLHIKILSEEYGILDLVPNLVELTLAGKNWAAIPGAFYGMDVVFPRLDTLTLQGLENLHKWHFDWVLSHKSLRNLNLHQCTIATHCLVQQPKFVFWRVNLDGWVRVQDDTHDPDHQHRFPIDYTPTPDDDEPGWYVSSLWWDTLFDRIRKHLPRLEAFSFDAKEWENYFRHVEDPLSSYTEIGFRYSWFAHGWSLLQPRPWLPERSVLNCIEKCQYVEAGVIGRPEVLPDITEQADSQALEKLLQTVEGRRRNAGR